MKTETNEILTPTATTFDQLVLRSEVPVLVDFWAPWCGPCQALKPHVEELASKLDGRARVALVNVDDPKELADRFGIQSIPALRLFKGGQVVGSHEGLLTGAALDDFVGQAF